MNEYDLRSRILNKRIEDYPVGFFTWSKENITL